MTLIRHCIVDTNTNIVVNIIDYETVQTGVAPGFESNFICVASEVGQITDTYQNGIFTPKQPYPSWILENNVWVSPVAKPTDGKLYRWDEASTSWIAV